MSSEKLTALLDPQPRLDQSPFYELMAERPEVAAGIIRVLTRFLRDRVSDLSQLESRIKELEQASQKN